MLIFDLLLNCAELLIDEKTTEELPRMDARFAEGIVRQWQNIKSLAFGPDHSLKKLPEVRKYATCFPVKISI